MCAGNLEWLTLPHTWRNITFRQKWGRKVKEGKKLVSIHSGIKVRPSDTHILSKEMAQCLSNSPAVFGTCSLFCVKQYCRRWAFSFHCCGWPGLLKQERNLVSVPSLLTVTLFNKTDFDVQNQSFTSTYCDASRFLSTIEQVFFKQTKHFCDNPKHKNHPWWQTNGNVNCKIFSGQAPTPASACHKYSLWMSERCVLDHSYACVCVCETIIYWNTPPALC